MLCISVVSRKQLIKKILNIFALSFINPRFTCYYFFFILSSERKIVCIFLFQNVTIYYLVKNKIRYKRVQILMCSRDELFAMTNLLTNYFVKIQQHELYSLEDVIVRKDLI